MNVRNANNIAGYSYAYKNSSRTASGASSFLEGVQREIQELAASQGTTEKANSSVWARIWSFHSPRITAVLHMSLNNSLGRTINND